MERFFSLYKHPGTSFKVHLFIKFYCIKTFLNFAFCIGISHSIGFQMANRSNENAGDLPKTNACNLFYCDSSQCMHIYDLYDKSRSTECERERQKRRNRLNCSIICSNQSNCNVCLMSQISILIVICILNA